MNKTLLIADKRKEQAVKNSKIAKSIGFTVYLSENLNEGFEIFRSYEPEIILISDIFGKGECKAAIKFFREISLNLRPVIIVLSKSSELNDRIEYLEAGADDFWGEPVEHGEFKARLNAHIRRYFETETDNVTGLANQKLSFGFLKRTINTGKPWAAMLIGIDNFYLYKNVYGEFAGLKMTETLSAIIKTATDEDDFAGSPGEGEFLIVTHPCKAERLAKYLIYAFDTVASKFYGEKDIANGFLSQHGDEIPEVKNSLVCLSCGIISNEHRKITGLKQALNLLISVKKTVENTGKSGYNVDRPKIEAENGITPTDYNADVLILEPDEALSFLLETAAQIKGYRVRTNLDDENFKPAVVIIDTGDISDFNGFEVCRKIKNTSNFEKSFIIMTTTVHNKEKVLDAGADMYLPKPYDTAYLFEAVEKAVRKYNM